jgi:hypothetical protein
MPAHAPASVLHRAQRHRILARREGIIRELALARQNFGPGIEERTRLDRNPRPRTSDGAVGLSSVRLGLDRRYVNHRCSEHCKAQPRQTRFNAQTVHDTLPKVVPVISRSEPVEGSAVGTHPCRSHVAWSRRERLATIEIAWENNGRNRTGQI